MRRFPLSLLLAATLLGLFVSRSFATPADDIAATTRAWVDAFNTREPERILALYADDAVFWGTTSATLRDTPAEIREYFITSPQRPHVRVAIDEQRIRVHGDIALNTGAYTFTNKVDGQPTKNQARFTFVYRRVGDRWLIIDHHSSALPAR